MEAVYPVTALTKKQKVVKEAAKKDLVRITEHGEGAYIFCSEEVYERKVERAVREALYEAELDFTISRGLADYEAGRVYRGTAAAKDELARRMASNA